MFKLTRTGLSVLCAVILSALSTQATEPPVEGGGQNAVRRYEQTRDGVTVRIEKIARERVLNTVGWLRKQIGPNWQNEVPPGIQSEPIQLVRILVSVTSDETQTERIAKTGGTLVFAKSISGNQSHWGPLITAAFDASTWQQQLPDLEVDPKAHGTIFLKAVKGSMPIGDLSPAELKFQVTTERGKEIEFLFSNLEF